MTLLRKASNFLKSSEDAALRRNSRLQFLSFLSIMVYETELNEFLLLK